MTGRYARLIAVAILIAAFSASISAQMEATKLNRTGFLGDRIR